MATQKQRRRRAKEKRHDYDLVFIDEDGVERPVEREEPRRPPGRLGRRGTAPSSAKGDAKPSSTGKGRPRGRAARPVQPPSWRRVLKRGAIFAPIFLATVMLLGGKKVTFAGAVFQTALLIAVFIPFSYFMDRVVWRQYLKRTQKS